MNIINGYVLEAYTVGDGGHGLLKIYIASIEAVLNASYSMEDVRPDCI